MNKLISKIVGVCLGLSLATGVGIGVAMGQDKGLAKADATTSTSTLTFTAACGGSGTANDGATWTITSDVDESVYDDTKGIHYGTSKKAVSYIQLSCSSITGTITQIVVNASGASETSGVIDITVGGNEFDSQKSITNSASNYTFTDSESGTIVVRISQSSAKKALYCKSIAVTYEASTPLSTMKIVNSSGDEGPYNMSYHNEWLFYAVDSSTHAYLNGLTWTVSDTTNLTLTAFDDYCDIVASGIVTNAKLSVSKSGYSLAEATINVSKGTLSSIAISGSMSKTNYVVDNSWDPTGLVVTATYSSSYSQVVTSDSTFSYSPATATSTAVTSVTVTASYTEDSVTKTATKTQAVTVTEPTVSGTFSLFAGALEEGDYVIVSNGVAMNTTLASDRLGYSSVTIEDDTIENPDSALIWHIAPSGDYWTIYSEVAGKYAFGTGVKNKIGLSTDGSANGSLWTASGTSTYEFVNKANAAASVNANLRYNAGYGFACYGTGTGGALSLYQLEVTRELESLTITGEMTKTEYFVGDDWDPTGLVVTANYDDESTRNITSLLTDSDWSFDPVSASSTSITSVVATATYTENGVTESAGSSSQTVSVLYANSSTLVPGTNGYSDSAETETISWENGVKTTTAYLNGVCFQANGGGNTGKYYSSASDWRFYQNESATLTISTDVEYKISSITFTFSYANNGALYAPDGTTMIRSGNVWTPSSASSTFTFSIGATSGTTGQIKFTEIAVVYVENTNPAVLVSNPGELEVGDEGTFEATVTNATHPVVTWASSDSTIVSVTAATGAYEVLKTGSVTITASLTCDEGSASHSISVNVNLGLISIADALDICEDLASGATTSYYVKISGFITDLDADDRGEGNERALTISDAKTSGNSITVFGVYNSDALRNYAVINGTVTYKGQLTNYSGSYQLKNLTLVDYTDDAIEFARAAYQSLTEVCTTGGPDAVTDSQWNSLISAWEGVDSYSKAKLQSADSDYPYSEDIANWITRYTIIVQHGKSDFMSLGISQSSRAITIFSFMNDKSSVALVLIIATLGVTTAGAYFFLRKKKEEK